MTKFVFAVNSKCTTCGSGQMCIQSANWAEYPASYFLMKWNAECMAWNVEVKAVSFGFEMSYWVQIDETETGWLHFEALMKMQLFWVEWLAQWRCFERAKYWLRCSSQFKKSCARKASDWLLWIKNHELVQDVITDDNEANGDDEKVTQTSCACCLMTFVCLGNPWPLKTLPMDGGW